VKTINSLDFHSADVIVVACPFECIVVLIGILLFILLLRSRALFAKDSID
jgi:hypothetical protein